MPKHRLSCGGFPGTYPAHNSIKKNIRCCCGGHSKNDHRNISISTCKFSLPHQEVKSISPHGDLEQVLPRQKAWKPLKSCTLWALSHIVRSPWSHQQERLCGESKRRYRGPPLLHMLQPPPFSAQFPDRWVNKPLGWPQPACSLTETLIQNCSTEYSWISDLQKLWENKWLFLF